jgi:enediyne biosynthesis protein E4
MPDRIFDGDSRLDLAVTQNGAETKLLRNVRATPGVRVTLVGPNGNPLGIGAQIWAENAQGRTAVQEIQAGSGYLAQDSAIKILAADVGSTVRVRWPGGPVSSVRIDSATNAISLSAAHAR